MQYFIYPVVLLLYFEILGRWVFAKFKREAFDFSFVLGFIVFLGLMFTLFFPITVFHLPFYYLLIATTFLFSLSIYFIVKDYRKINWKINYKHWAIFVVLMILALIASWFRTVGETHGFDTLFYLNIVSNNIEAKQLFSIHPHFGTISFDFVRADYTFQSFYTFASVVIYVFEKLFSSVGIAFETMPAFVWGFQIILSAIYIATTLISLKEIKAKNKIMYVAYAVIFLFFMGSLYYNQVYGFIGNNYRFSILAIESIFIYRYFKTNSRTDLILFLLSLPGLAAVSSTGSFSIVFFLFGLFFVLVDKEDDILKLMLPVLYVPTINILCTKFDSRVDICLYTFVLFVIIFLLNDRIIQVYRKKYIKIATVIAASLLLFILSYRITGNIFNFYAFTNNFSETADMSFDYFMFNDIRHYIFNPMVLVPLFYMIIRRPKSEFSVCYLILIVVFFNPFNVTFMNEVNWVYYRAYDIIINQFTLMMMFEILYQDLEQTKFKQVFTLGILACSIILALVQIPIYYHPSFIPDEDYNYIYKIQNAELDVIYHTRDLIDEKNIVEAKIVTPTFYMPAYIKGTSYLYGKEKRYNWGEHYSDITYQLWLIFFPSDNDYDNFKADNVPQYENTCDLIRKSDYDILIEDKFRSFTQDGQETLKTALVESCGYQSSYENWKYKVYFLK